MDIRPLTKEQRRFAEENHHLVFTFLNQKDLPESAFYDVVIFGYLKAVQEYCEVQALHRFKFSTLAFQRMRSSLSNYYKCLSRPKRNAPVVSFSELIGDEGGLYWEEVISRQDELFQRLEAEMCLHALAARLPRREMRIIRMKVRGDRMEIPNVEWILLGGYGKLKRSWIESVMERKGNIPVFMIGSKLFKDVWRAPLIQEYPPLLYRPAEKTLPHCSECKYCYSVRQGKRGLWRACRHYKIVRQDKDSGGRHIPGRYAAVSPQWCPKRPETNWRFTKRV